MSSHHSMPFSAQALTHGGTAFRLWAPSIASAELELQGRGETSRHAMHRDGDGWHRVEHDDAKAGTRYRFIVDGVAMPDPASRFNPQGVHGTSMVVDPDRYEWRDAAWQGRPWTQAVISEVHIGSFTRPGTFAAAALRLRELAECGFTAIELMPVAAFAGTRGWGYDGVLPFAPHCSYGSPDEMKGFVDTAHSLGLMVLLDVVYNHFGPEGNHLHTLCPEFFSSTHKTPWGAAINFDGPESGTVRDFFRHNALYWVEEFHIDGLRLDAVHAMHDDSACHITCEIADALRFGPGREREVHLILENDANEASRLARSASGAPLCATAQWNDDLHHAAHVVLTGETEGYYGDFSIDPQQRLAQALARGFVYQGQPSTHRHTPSHGEPSGHLPSSAFVSFLQNHDQIGNRAFGDRLHDLADGGLIEAMYVCLLLSPHIPLMFMGEEFAASTPFAYFCDFEPELAAAVATGRRAEFARFAAFRNEASRQRIPDPNARSTFERTRLRWRERSRPQHRERLELIRDLLAQRHKHLTPRMAGQLRGGQEQVVDGLIRVCWPLGDGSDWYLFANFGGPIRLDESPVSGTLVHERGIERASDGSIAFASGATLVVADAAFVAEKPSRQLQTASANGW